MKQEQGDAWKESALQVRIRLAVYTYVLGGAAAGWIAAGLWAWALVMP